MTVRTGMAEYCIGPRTSGLRRRSDPPGGSRLSVAGRPGLLLDAQVALDREHTASVPEIEQLDQLRVDVQLMTVLAQPAGDAEAQPLGQMRPPAPPVPRR